MLDKKNKIYISITMIVILLLFIFVGGYSAFEIYQKYNKNGEVRGFIDGIFMQEEIEKVEEIPDTQFLFEYSLEEFYPYEKDGIYYMSFTFPHIVFDTEKNYLISVNENNLLTSQDFSILKGYASLVFKTADGFSHVFSYEIVVSFTVTKTTLDIIVRDTTNVGFFNTYIDVNGFKVIVKEEEIGATDGFELLPVESSGESESGNADSENPDSSNEGDNSNIPSADEIENEINLAITIVNSTIYDIEIFMINSFASDVSLKSDNNITGECSINVSNTNEIERIEENMSINDSFAKVVIKSGERVSFSRRVLSLGYLAFNINIPQGIAFTEYSNLYTTMTIYDESENLVFPLPIHGCFIMNGAPQNGNGVSILFPSSYLDYLLDLNNSFVINEGAPELYFIFEEV